MKAASQIKHGLTLAALLLSSACSLKDRTEVHSVSVQLPKEWKAASSMNVLNHSSFSTGLTSYSAPTSLGSFQCYALNVTGPGIQADPRMGCTDPNSGMGLVAGFVPTSSGSIELLVPAGAARKVELIGIQSTVGCPILDELLRTGGTQALDTLGDPYVLGSTVTDIFDDTAVTIVASFNSTSKAFSGCGGGGGSSGPNLALRDYAGFHLVQANFCSQTYVYGFNAPDSNPVSILPQVVTPAANGTTDIYDASDCSNPFNYVMAMPTPEPPSYQGNAMPIYFQSTGNPGDTFQVKIAAQSAGWSDSPTVTYTLVPDRIEMSPGYAQAYTGECASFYLNRYDSSMSMATIGSLDLHAFGDNNTLPTFKVYQDYSDCSTDTNEIVGIQVGSKKVFNLTPTNVTSFGSNSGNFYIKSATAQKSFMVLVSANGLAQPATADVQYLPPLAAFTLAGSAGMMGYTDGTGTSAEFNSPRGITRDLNGVLYIADTANHVIRKVTTAGVVTTFAGAGSPGFANGTGAAAYFNNPTGVAVDSSSNVYVADQGNYVIRKITPAGVVTTLAGSGTQGSANGTGVSASFNEPTGIALDFSGNLYVTDSGNNKIRKITPAGVVTDFSGTGSYGSSDGSAYAASFNYPTGIAISPTGDLYVADTFNNTIRKVNSIGDVTTFAGSGSAGDTAGYYATSCDLNAPMGVAVYPNGDVLITDTGNHRIKIVTYGMMNNYAGTGVYGSTDDVVGNAEFYSPMGIITDGADGAWVADADNQLIRAIHH